MFLVRNMRTLISSPLNGLLLMITWREIPVQRGKPQNRSWRYGTSDALLFQFLWFAGFGLSKSTKHGGSPRTEDYRIVLDRRILRYYVPTDVYRHL